MTKCKKGNTITNYKVDYVTSSQILSNDRQENEHINPKMQIECPFEITKL